MHLPKTGGDSYSVGLISFVGARAKGIYPTATRRNYSCCSTLFLLELAIVILKFFKQ
jgi:hypothetical protein